MKHILFSMAITIIAWSTSCTKSSSYGGGSGGGGSTSNTISNSGSSGKVTTELLTEHTWVLSQTLYNGINTIKSCQEDNELIFKTTGLSYQNTHSICPGENPDYSAKLWSYDAHSKILLFESLDQQLVQEFALVKIDNSTLVLSPSTGIQFVYHSN